MDFDENIDQYLEKEFLTYICENDQKADQVFLGINRNNGTFLKYCTASGSTIPGMPNIILVTNSDIIGNSVAKIFKFSPTDYFIYPTHKQSQTQAIKGIYGLQMNSHGSTKFDKIHYVMGQLFVAKFHLKIQYEYLKQPSGEK